MALLNDLIEESPQKVELWLKEIDDGKTNPPIDFNWLGLADVSANLARENVDKDKNLSLAWAKISLKVYAALTNSVEEEFSHGFELSAMLLRTFLINHLDNISGHPIPDSGIILNWFYEKAELTLKEALELTKLWNTMHTDGKINEIKENLSQLKKVRNIKNRLTIIDLLDKTGKIVVNNTLRNWLKVRKELF